jgi:hypothetical protein
MQNIPVNDEVFAGLQAVATRDGLTVDAYLARVAREADSSTSGMLSGRQLLQLLEAEPTDGGSYQGTFSRSDLYRDHD